MRERQKEAAKRWLVRNKPVEISLQNGGCIQLSWGHENRMKSITGIPGDTVDDLLMLLTEKDWTAVEAEDRKNEPTYDRT